MRHSSRCLAALALACAAGAADAFPTPFFAMTDDRSAPVLLRRADGSPVMSTFYDLTASGVAFIGPHAEAHLGGGSYRAERIGEHLAQGLSAEAGFTCDLVAEPMGAPAVGACLMAYATGKEAPMLSLAATGSGLRWTVGTTTLDVGPGPGRRHLLLSAGGGRLTAWVDGAPAGEAPLPAMPARKPGALRIGNDASRAHPWQGVIELLAIGTGTTTAPIAAERARQRLASIAARPAVPRIAMTATLVTRSESEEPEYVAYNKAYVLCEYRVERVSAGTFNGATVRVAQWLFLDRKLLTNATRAIGSSHELLLEPMTAHPELRDEQGYDTLAADEGPVFFDVSPVAYPASPKPTP